MISVMVLQLSHLLPAQTGPRQTQKPRNNVRGQPDSSQQSPIREQVTQARSQKQRVE